MTNATPNDEPIFHSIPTQRRMYYLRDKCCSTCESTDDLELHHIDPSNKITSNFWGSPKERREAELRKCIVLCRKCHQEVTAAQTGTTQHGSLRMYLHYKCRCEVCVEAHRAYKRQYHKHYVRKENRPA